MHLSFIVVVVTKCKNQECHYGKVCYINGSCKVFLRQDYAPVIHYGGNYNMLESRMSLWKNNVPEVILRMVMDRS